MTMAACVRDHTVLQRMHAWRLDTTETTCMHAGQGTPNRSHQHPLLSKPGVGLGVDWEVDWEVDWDPLDIPLHATSPPPQ